jgi:hypothetical protein
VTQTECAIGLALLAIALGIAAFWCASDAHNRINDLEKRK